MREIIKEILELAVNSLSSHNPQPLRFEVSEYE